MVAVTVKISERVIAVSVKSINEMAAAGVMSPIGIERQFGKFLSILHAYVRSLRLEAKEKATEGTHSPCYSGSLVTPRSSCISLVSLICGETHDTKQVCCDTKSFRKNRKKIRNSKFEPEIISRITFISFRFVPSSTAAP